MRPTLLQIGQRTVRSYTLLLDLGLLMGLGVFAWRARCRIARPDRWLDAALAALAAGVLGARLGYVWAHWPYFQERSGQILKFWRGGLSWHGALVGGLLGLGLYCWLRKLSFWRVADELALVAPLVGTAAWLGCLLAGCAYGREMDQAHWMAADLPDVFGVWALRANVQLLAAGWSLLVAGVLWGLRRPLPDGMRLALFLLLYGAGLACIDPFRGDAVPHWGAWRADVVLDWMAAAGGGLIIGVVWLRGLVLPLRGELEGGPAPKY